MPTEYKYILDTGTIVADTADILSDVESEWKAAISQTLNVKSSTPQGTMIAGETIARTYVMKNNAELANVINPNLSYGTFLDAVCAFLGIGRGTNQSTTATGVKITGNPLVVIQAGSRVQTSSGAVFDTIAAATIGAGGTGILSLKSKDYGSVPLGIGLLNIIDGTIGWGTCEVDGSTVVIAGSTSLNDPQLKNQRNLQLATQGTGHVAAIRAAVLKVPNVTSCQVIENNTGQIVTPVNGVTFTKPNAMWVCVAGTPVEADLADALWEAHGGGCPYDGGAGAGAVTTTPVVDPSTGLNYSVTRTSPALFDAYVIANVKTGTSASSPEHGIQNAIVNYAAGNITGEQGFVVGASVSGFELGGAISYSLPGIYVKSVTVAIVAAGAAAPLPGAYSTEAILSPFQQAQISVGNIKVNIV